LLAPSTTPPKRAEPIGIELRQLVDALTQSGRELHGIAEPNLAGHLRDMLDRVDAISCRIAVVGQVKAGKSSFINALMQRGELLPTHVNPWTAVATKLHFGTPGRPVSGCDFTFFTAEEWAALGQVPDGNGGAQYDDGFAEMKHRAEVRLGENFHHLLGKTHFYQSVQAGVLQNYLCAGPPVGEVSREVKPGRYADITKSANVYFPLPPLAMPAILVDTPGTNDPTHLRLRITREIIEGADIYIVVLTARQPLASSDLGLLKLLRGLEKKRIIVFINRVDELNEKAANADVVVQHVKDELRRVFGDVSIPVVAGSAKWAGLATEDDGERLRREAQMPAFTAVAAQRSIAIPAPGGADGDPEALQRAFRKASGLDAVTKLLSLFMLSGFLSNHARGVANVLLSAGELSATSARRELHTAAQRLHAQGDGVALNGADALHVRLAEIRRLLKTIETSVQAIKDEAAPAVRDGISRLEASLEAHIQSIAEPKKPASAPAAAPSGTNGTAAPETRSRPGAAEDDGHSPGERSDWLSSVKEVTFDFIRRALAEGPPQREAAARPAATRSSSLTVPVTAVAKDVSMDSGVSWWSEWLSNGGMDGKSGGALTQFAGQDLTPLGEAPGSTARDRLRYLSDHSAKRLGLTSIAPLVELGDAFLALQARTAGRTSAEQEQLAHLAAQYDRAINEACLAIATYEKVTRQVRALFTPPANAG
jgi:signal recognition particle receptor subunit beta